MRYMDIEKSPDNKISPETSTPNKSVPESRPQEEPKDRETERVAHSNARSLAGIRKKIVKAGNPNPSVRDTIEFLRASVNESGADIKSLEKSQDFQARVFKGKTVPALWGNTETIESFREEVRSYEELIAHLGMINDQDRKLEDVVREWEVPTDELLDVIDEVKERIRNQVGANSLGRGESLLSWKIKKYDQVAEILGRHADEINASGLSVSKVEELIGKNKSELEKAGLTKIAGEIIEALRERSS